MSSYGQSNQLLWTNPGVAMVISVRCPYLYMHGNPWWRTAAPAADGPMRTSHHPAAVVSKPVWTFVSGSFPPAKPIERMSASSSPLTTVMWLSPEKVSRRRKGAVKMSKGHKCGIWLRRTTKSINEIRVSLKQTGFLVLCSRQKWMKVKHRWGKHFPVLEPKSACAQTHFL